MFTRGDAEPGESVKGIVTWIEARAPALVRERRIGDHKVELLERVPFFEFRIGKRVALDDRCRWGVMQDHVHPGQNGGGRVFFLPVERHWSRSLVRDFEEQRTRTAGRIAHCRVRAGFGRRDADDPSHDQADFGRR